MKNWLAPHTFLMLFLFPAPLLADEQNSFVTLEKITVTPLKAGQFEVELKASFTLGVNDKLVAQGCTFTDPNKKDIVPDCKFTPPEPGKSCKFAVKFTTGTKGTWKAGTVRMLYKTASGFDGVAEASSEFSVP
jgi:hypothetical protein